MTRLLGIGLCFLVVGCGQSVFSAPPSTATQRNPPIDLGAQTYDRDLGDLAFYVDQAVPVDELAPEDIGLNQRDQAVPDDLRRADDLRKQTHPDFSHPDFDTEKN
jgi:hypothetical protein